MANDVKLVSGKVVGDPTEGALLVLAHKAGLDIVASRAALPRGATLPFDPTSKIACSWHLVSGGVVQNAPEAERLTRR